MYSSKFVMAVLLNGKPQNERKDGVVQIPFESEYQLRFRNKHNRRAVVQFTIDGENESGPGYIIPANNSVDILRRFAKDEKFKFVTLDSPEAVDFGKNNGNEDGGKGVIEARFFLEKERPPEPVHIHHHHDHYYPKPYPIYPDPYPWPWTWRPYTKGTVYRGGDTMCRLKSTNSYEATKSVSSSDADKMAFGATMSMCDNSPASESLPQLSNPYAPKKELIEGCTVGGAASGQKFSTQDIDLETDYVPLRIILRGYKTDATPIQVANEEMSHCTQCGTKRSRKTDKFCGSCGQKF